MLWRPEPMNTASRVTRPMWRRVHAWDSSEHAGLSRTLLENGKTEQRQSGTRPCRQSGGWICRNIGCPPKKMAMGWTPGFHGNQQEKEGVDGGEGCHIDSLPLGSGWTFPSPSRPLASRGLPKARGHPPASRRLPKAPGHPPVSSGIPKAPEHLWLCRQAAQASRELRQGVLNEPASSSGTCRQGGTQHIKCPLWEKISHRFCSLFRPKGATWLPQRNTMQGGLGGNMQGLSGKGQTPLVQLPHNVSLTRAVTRPGKSSVKCAHCQKTLKDTSICPPVAEQA